jgi:hypothetical protein
MARRTTGRDRAHNAGQPPARQTKPTETAVGLAPFPLFCAYHLGLAPDGRRAFANIHQVARSFGVDVAAVEAALVAHRMDSARLMALDFDLAGAQADIALSPPGVDLLGLAEMHFAAFLAAGDKPRDWATEWAADAAENARVFGDGVPGRDDKT